MPRASLLAPPETASELLTRAHTLAGMTLQEVASVEGVAVPENLRREKGWVGELLECALGATALCQPEPDFQALGIELKTVPINPQGKPYESTYVCKVPLTRLSHLTWETSLVWSKLQHVLWVPIEAEPTISLGQRRVGLAKLWRPSLSQTAVLKADWEELTDMICMGRLAEISARLGQYLQIRPKGANAAALCAGIGEEGQPTVTLPRGFYLRTQFTQQILLG